MRTGRAETAVLGAFTRAGGASDHEVAAAVAALRGAWRWCVPWAVWHKDTSHLTLRGHEDSVLAVAVAEQGGRPLIVSGSGDQTVRVWDLETGEGVGEPLRGHEWQVSAVAVAEHGGRRLIVSGGDRTVRVWDLETGEGVGE